MKKRHTGLLIAIEGIDGSGKSTLVQLLTERLEKEGKVLATREPGGSELGNHIRKVVHEVRICPQAEFLLFAADRAQHRVEKIEPALQEGYIVISDRMADSSYAYQGYGRGLDISVLRLINQWAMQSLEPDIVFYIKIDVESAWKRIISRNERLTNFEQEKRDFFERVSAGFDKLFQDDKRVIVLDGNQTPECLAEQAYGCIKQRLSEKS